MLSVNIETSPNTGHLIWWYLHNTVKQIKMPANTIFVTFLRYLWHKYDNVAISIEESRSSLMNQNGCMSISKSFMMQILNNCFT